MAQNIWSNRNSSSSHPSPYYHEYEPNFDKDFATTQSYLKGKSHIKTPRKIRIIAIGAAASSLAFAREVREGRIENASLVLYEKNSGIGGTWFENNYPGCACDIPSHVYQYNWAPNPEWTHYYSQAPEIRAYFEKVAKVYDLDKYVRLNHQVVMARWEQSSRQWHIEVKNTSTGEVSSDTADFLINGGGIINNWKWPSIEGLNSFKGKLLHSASWNDKINCKDKKVVVIGNGSSGVQIVASLAAVVNNMTVIMRSPTWITAGFAPQFGGPNGENIAYTREQQNEWREDPQIYLTYRKALETELNKRFRWVLKGSPEQRVFRDFSFNQMKEALALKPELIKKLIPSFDVGCRRPTPGNGYLEALVRDNVSVSFGTPQRITEKGIVLHDGQLAEADIIICATGFDLSFKPRFPLVGKNDTHLANLWTPDAKAYMSLAVPQFPNYLHYLGPATTAAQGSIIPTIERLTNYFVKIINKVQREGYATFEPRQDCVEELYAHHQEFLQHTVWSSHCTSTFKNGTSDGKINLLHGGSRLHHFDMLEDPRWEDFHWTLLPGVKRYDYFGDGFSEKEEQGRDITWYMNNPSKALL